MGNLVAIVAIGALVIAGAVLWRIRRRAQMYDLRYWNVDPVEEPDHEGMVDEDSGPYCRYCDNPNPPGTNYCRSRGQKIA